MESFIVFSQNEWLQLKQNLTPYKKPKKAKQCLKAITLINQEIQLLNTKCKANSFPTMAEEILFFKKIKPKFVALLLFYQILYKSLLQHPFNHQKRRKKLIRKSSTFLKKNQKWITYYNTNSSHYDEIYFCRKNKALNTVKIKNCVLSNPLFSTKADIKMAQVLAHKKLLKFCNKRHQNTTKTATISTTSLQWSAPKVALVELIYAIHASGTCNQGKATLKETISHFEQSFNIKLGQYARKYLEIRNRKTIEKTQFLNTLKQELEKRMVQLDEK
ncbi:RteC domain-containing protein [Flavobacterium sp.]|uniref:RteC domain-containing protein n=1 Tax=Flavobacterium sp. TaxID=239 RepID=UPI002B8C1538|nr:RteC domain-containing protein [Flavobacterium sp.]HQA75399.1 RteC domain-containing protein [Flavobacterium sp.]